MSKSLRLGIDASNIRTGGGVTHLKNLLLHANPEKHPFEHIIVWGASETLKQLPVHSWLRLQSFPELEGSLPQRLWWQQTRLHLLAQEAHCDLLFIPGGLYLGKFRPFVTMFQNMQIFDWKELKRESWSLEAMRLIGLQIVQSLTFYRAKGLICISNYASTYLKQHFPLVIQKTPIEMVPHGIQSAANANVTPQAPIESYSQKSPFRLLYVSTVKQYKHQWNLIEAVARLRKQGYALTLDLVGAGTKDALKRMNDAMVIHDPHHEWIKSHGNQSSESVLEFYKNADLFVFPSSCENLPIILLEAMASALPIACSSSPPMPEILEDAGLYFDPESISEMAFSIEQLLLNPQLREELAQKALKLSQNYTWEQCAAESFEFLFQCSPPKKSPMNSDMDTLKNDGDVVSERYLSGDYFEKNPSWDSEDSAWKAKRVAKLITEPLPKSICEVGCGAGGVLAELKSKYSNAEFYGFDIAPAASTFWKQHSNIKFQLGDFFELNEQNYDLILLLDVLEHVANPFQFLVELKTFSNQFIFHFPLDLSASSVLRETPLLYSRKEIGHIHYFTKNLALSLLEECGYRVLRWEYTGAASSAPQRNWKSRLASFPRSVAYAFNKELGVRLLGGETLMVLAEVKA